MTTAELAALKEELKAELLAEITASKTTNHWNKIRPELESRLGNLGPQERYQTMGAISTIVRHALGIKAVGRLREDQAGRAREIALKVLEAMGR